jgi:hypothetical protein
MKEHSELYWWLFDRVPIPVYRAWRWVREKPGDIKANRLRKKGIVPAEDAWNSNITICNMLAQHLKWHLKWLDEQYNILESAEENAKYKAEMVRAHKALSRYEDLCDITKPATKQQLREVQWAIHWVARNIHKLWF